MKTKTPTRSKLRAARRSMTVWFSVSIPALLAVAEALKDQLPALPGLLSGWTLVAVSAAVSAVVTVLRVRSIQAEAPAPLEPVNCYGRRVGPTPPPPPPPPREPGAL